MFSLCSPRPATVVLTRSLPTLLIPRIQCRTETGWSPRLSGAAVEEMAGTGAGLSGTIWIVKVSLQGWLGRGRPWAERLRPKIPETAALQEPSAAPAKSRALSRRRSACTRPAR